TEAELGGVVERTGAKLRDSLGAGRLAAGEMAIVNATLPTNSDAARHYADGLAKLRLLAANTARDELERSIALEPSVPQANAALAEALSYLGHEARARDEAKKAVELSATLPEVERLRVEGASHLISGDATKAAEVYRKLFEAQPDNLEWGIRLATSQFSSGD